MYKLAILGDLHYEQREDRFFKKARRQIKKQHPDYVVSLGDVGGYSHPGSQKSFEEAIDFLSGFKIPYKSLIGNHDLECPDFPTDQDSINCWKSIFNQNQSYASFDLGPALGITLSSEMFRDNPIMKHEIVISDQQKEWFIQTLKDNPNRLTFVFCHVPFLGSGLKVLQNLHLKFANAFLNHNHNPWRIQQIVQDYPQIKFWFSGHNHMGQNYPDAISLFSHCLSVHTGVISKVSRDGHKQSRFLKFNEQSFELYTIDHNSDDGLFNLATPRLDAKGNFGDTSSISLRYFDNPEEGRHYSPPALPPGDDHITLGNSIFHAHMNMLLEYDKTRRCPMGVVVEHLNGRKFEIIDDQLVLKTSAGFLPDDKSEKIEIVSPGPTGTHYFRHF